MYTTFNTFPKFMGLIGKPIEHSYSPMIFKITFELLGLNCLYYPINIEQENIKNLLKCLPALNFNGLNVTSPYKEEIIRYLDKIDDDAKVIKVVNTVAVEYGKLIGYNTDIFGIFNSLKPYSFQIAEKDVLILGGGSTAKSAIVALSNYFNPNSITLVNRNIQKAKEIQTTLNKYYNYNKIAVLEYTDISHSITKYTLVINCTKVGLAGSPENKLPIELHFDDSQIFFDLNYSPESTLLLQSAQKEGAMTLSGWRMLIYQASEGFKIWTGEEMPTEEIFKAFRILGKNFT